LGLPVGGAKSSIQRKAGRRPVGGKINRRKGAGTGVVLWYNIIAEQ